ncbi:hypothetical protein ACJX0J_013795 [Zea mays]
MQMNELPDSLYINSDTFLVYLKLAKKWVLFVIMHRFPIEKKEARGSEQGIHNSETNIQIAKGKKEEDTIIIHSKALHSLPLGKEFLPVNMKGERSLAPHGHVAKVNFDQGVLINKKPYGWFQLMLSTENDV